MPVFKIKQNGEWVDIAGGGNGGEIPDNLVYVSEENQESAVVPLDADTFGGYPVENFIKQDNVINNFITTDEGYVADARALKTLNDKFNMDLLWQNASYTSSFDSQSITVDVSNYNLFVIRYRLSNTDAYDYFGTDICVKGYRGWMSTAMGSGGQTGAYTFSLWRQVLVSSGGTITFFKCYKNNKTTNAPEEDNTWLIPYQIFGIKGGITTL